jgi:hypothetical protein
VNREIKKLKLEYLAPALPWFVKIQAKKGIQKFISQKRKFKWTSGVRKDSGGKIGSKSNIFAPWTRKFY